MISRASKTARISWAVAYLFLLMGGIVAFFSPSKTIESSLVEILVYGWATFLTLGGFACLIGKLQNNWAGEIIGLPLLAAANYIFGILLLLRGPSTATIAIGGLFLGFGTAFIGRWIELRRLARDNQEVNSEY